MAPSGQHLAHVDTSLHQAWRRQRRDPAARAWQNNPSRYSGPTASQREPWLALCPFCHREWTLVGQPAGHGSCPFCRHPVRAREQQRLFARARYLTPKEALVVDFLARMGPLSAAAGELEDFAWVISQPEWCPPHGWPHDPEMWRSCGLMPEKGAVQAVRALLEYSYAHATEIVPDHEGADVEDQLRTLVALLRAFEEEVRHLNGLERWDCPVCQKHRQGQPCPGRIEAGDDTELSALLFSSSSSGPALCALMALPVEPPPEVAPELNAALAEAGANRSRMAHWRDRDAPSGQLYRGETVGGRLVVLESLGSGGMGAVFKAYDPSLDRAIAIKLVRPELGGGLGSPACQRLVCEAQVLGNLRHPNVVTVFDCGIHRQQILFAQEFIEGRDLNAWFSTPPPPEQSAVMELLIQAGRGLAAAHQAGVVHRDFKPANVLVGEDGRVRVIDFGLADFALEGVKLAAEIVQDRDADVEAVPVRQLLGRMKQRCRRIETGAGAMMGTPAYMAPEQFAGSTVGARSDQFAYCITLYEALYDRRPFVGCTLEELERNVASGQVGPDPGGVPPAIRAVILRGLSVDPGDRYADMQELLSYLERSPDPEPVELGRLEKPSIERDWLLRRRRWVEVAIGFAMATLTAFAIWTQAITTEQPCTNAASDLENIWDPKTQEAIRQAFLATGKPHAQDTWAEVATRLTAHTRSYVAVKTQVCVATRLHAMQRGDVIAMRRFCLKRKLGELSELRRGFAHVDALMLDRTVEAVRGLSDISECADAQVLEQLRTRPAQEIARLLERSAELARVNLARAQTLNRLGKHREALETAHPELEGARRRNDAALEAEAWLVVAAAHSGLKGLREGQGSLAQAFATSLRSGHRKVAAQAVHALARAGLGNRAQHDAASGSNEHAETIADVLGRLVIAEANRWDALASIDCQAGRFDQAASKMRQGLALLRRALGDGHPQVIAALGRLGEILHEAGDHPQAKDLLQEALRRADATLGEGHARISGLLALLGRAQLRAAERPKASASFERAAALCARADPRCEAKTLLLLAQGLRDVGGAEALSCSLASQALSGYAEADPPPSDKVRAIRSWLADNCR